MPNAFIEQAPGGEITAPDGTERFPASKGTQDYFVQMLNFIARKLRETGTGQTLDMGSVADGKFLRRSGTTIVGSEVNKLEEGGGPTTLTISSIGDGQALKRSGSSIVGHNIGEPYVVTPSVASNNLTVAIKRRNGLDPSGGNMIIFMLGGSEYTLAVPASFTLNAGTNWFNSGSTELAALDVDYFVYAIGESGASAGLKFGISRIPYAFVMNDFINTTTDEKYIGGNWTNFNANDPVLNIGRIRARLSASPFNWSMPVNKSISHQIFDTDWLGWSEQYTGFSSVPSMSCFYKVVFDECHINTFLSANGTSNSTSATQTLPFKSAVSHALAAFAGVTDNGVLQSTPGHGQFVSANSNVLSVWKSFFQGAWTASGSKGWNFPNFYYRLR